MIVSLRRETPGDEIHVAGFSAILVVILSLAACGTVPPVDSPSQATTPIDTAASLSRQGRHEAAADLYQQMAQQAGAADRQRYLILTARERRLAGTPEVAEKILQRIGQPVDEPNLLLWAQVSAEVAISMGDPAAALTDLSSAPQAEAAADATNLLYIRSQALFRLRQPVAATCSSRAL